MVHPTSAVAAILALSVAWGSASAAAQSSAAPDPDSVLKQNFAAEHEIGRRYPYRSRRSAGAEDRTDRHQPVADRALTTGRRCRCRRAFSATPFATGLVNPRRLLVLPNGDVLVAEQSAGYLTLLRDDGEGHAKWIDRHVEDLNRPYGLAWQGDHLLVADQDGIWRVPHVIGALRAGRRVPTQRVDQVPPEQRKPVAGAYGAEMITKKGVFGIVQGHQNRASGDRSENRRAVRRRRLVGQSRRRARAEGDDPALRRGRLEPDDLRLRHAQSDRARLPSADRRAVGGGAGARRARRQPAVRLSDPRAAGRVLRLALRLYRQASAARLRQSRAGQGGGDDHARPVVRGAFVGARPRVLRRRPVPGRIQGQPCSSR